MKNFYIGVCTDTDIDIYTTEKEFIERAVSDFRHKYPFKKLYKVVVVEEFVLQSPYLVKKD